MPGKPVPRENESNGGYGDEYVALFAGIAPVSNPEVVVVVTINEPGTDDYYGGTAAAPCILEYRRANHALVERAAG